MMTSGMVTQQGPTGHAVNGWRAGQAWYGPQGAVDDGWASYPPWAAQVNSQGHPFYMRPAPPLPTGLMGEPHMGYPMVGSYGDVLPPHMVAAQQSHMLAWQAAQQPWNWVQPQAPHPMPPHHLQCPPHYYGATRPSHPPQLHPQPQMNPAASLPSRPREPSASQNSNSNDAGLSRTQRRRRQREALAVKLGIHRRSQNEAAVAAAAAAEEEPALAAAAASPNQGGTTPAAPVPPDQGDTEEPKHDTVEAGSAEAAEGAGRQSESTSETSFSLVGLGLDSDRVY